MGAMPTFTRRSLLQIVTASSLCGCTRAPDDPLLAKAARLRPLFSRKSPPQAYDWLARHKEPGQSYAQYRKAVTARSVGSFDTLRIVPIGELTQGQTFVLDAVLDF